MDNKLIGNESNIVFYEDENNNTKVEVRLIDEDVWLNIEAISNLFNVDRSEIVRHINNIYKDEELDESSTCAKIAQVQKEENKFDKKYFDELLERIKTNRVSERMTYQKMADLFIATATDYNSKSEEAYTFFKIVQNKMHYAITGHTAAELIYNRANFEEVHHGTN